MTETQPICTRRVPSRNTTIEASLWYFMFTTESTRPGYKILRRFEFDIGIETGLLWAI